MQRCKALTNRFTQSHRCAIKLLLASIITFCASISLAQTTSPSFAVDFLQRHNQLRAHSAQCGSQSVAKTHSLKWSADLAHEALQHSQWLAKQQKLLHVNQQGQSLGSRLTQAGYRWREVAENLARSDQDSDAVIRLWLGSKNHCLNMFRPGISEMGAAVVDGYWTAIYARPTQ